MVFVTLAIDRTDGMNDMAGSETAGTGHDRLSDRDGGQPIAFLLYGITSMTPDSPCNPASKDERTVCGVDHSIALNGNDIALNQANPTSDRIEIIHRFGSIFGVWICRLPKP